MATRSTTSCRSTSPLQPPLRPDLRTSSLTVPINTMQGLDFNFSYTIQNIGTAGSAFSNAGYMFDQMPDPTHYAGFNLINPLAINGTQNVERRATLQHRRPVGGPTHAVCGGGQLEPDRRQQPGQQRHFDQLQRDGAGQAGPDREQHHRPGCRWCRATISTSPTRSRTSPQACRRPSATPRTISTSSRTPITTWASTWSISCQPGP